MVFNPVKGSRSFYEASSGGARGPLSFSGETIAGVGERGELGKTAEKHGHVPRAFSKVRRQKHSRMDGAAEKVGCMGREVALRAEVGGNRVDAMLIGGKKRAVHYGTKPGHF